MASQTGGVRVHFHDTVNINILPPSRHNVGPRSEEPVPEPYYRPNSADNRNATTCHQVFLRSQPRFRGFSQVGVAHFQLALGVVLNFVGGKIFIWRSYIIFWGPAFLICSGFLAVAAHNIVSIKLVRACNVLHTTSIVIIASGLVLSCIDAFRIFPCGSDCGSVGTMAIASFFLMTNLVQINLSGYVLFYGFHSMKYVTESPPQTQGNENRGYVPPDPPAYSEETFQEPSLFPQPPAYPQAPSFSLPPEYPQAPAFPLPPEYPQAPAFPPPPPYRRSSSSPPPFSEVVDDSQPPPYSA